MRNPPHIVTQREIAGHPSLDERTLVTRRERTFLSAATAVLVAIVLAPVWGGAEAISLAETVPTLAIPLEAELPTGLVALPLATLGAILATELRGVRRARGLVAAALFATVTVLGLTYATHAEAGLAALAPSARFGAVAVASVLVTVELFGAMGRASGGRMFTLRYLAATLAGAAPLVAVGVTPAAYLVAAAVLAWLPIRVLAKVLAVVLRVGPFQRILPPALIVEDRATFSAADERYSSVDDRRDDQGLQDHAPAR